MINKTVVLESINKVIYKGSYLNDKDLEAFFNKRKRGMTFLIENKYIEKVVQRNYGKLDIYFKYGKNKKITAKILTLEKAENTYYIGIEIENKKEILKCGFTNRELIEASLFLKKLYRNKVIFPDLKVLLKNNEEYLNIPFYNEEDELVCYKYMKRTEALGISKEKLKRCF